MSMNIDAILESVSAHLKRLRIRPEVIKPPVAKLGQMRSVETTLLPFPKQLQEFYLKYANGLVYSWEQKDHSGFLMIPSLERLVENYDGWKELVLWMDHDAFPHVADPALAKKTYKRMKKWLPLMIPGMPDGFCVDCGAKGAVVFHRHDWYDGGTGSNGHVIAKDLKTFIDHWSRVLFHRANKPVLAKRL
jgi:hypothetical protein